MHVALKPLSLEAWVDVRQDSTAASISWHEAQKPGVEVTVITLYVNAVNKNPMKTASPKRRKDMVITFFFFKKSPLIYVYLVNTRNVNSV